jgi:hypothetical protein
LLALSKASPRAKPSVLPILLWLLPSAAMRMMSPHSVPHQIEPSGWMATPSG